MDTVPHALGAIVAAGVALWTLIAISLELWLKSARRKRRERMRKPMTADEWDAMKEALRQRREERIRKEAEFLADNLNGHDLNGTIRGHRDKN